MMHSLTASNALHKARKAEISPPTPGEIIGQFVFDLFLPTNQPTVTQRILLLFTVGRIAPSLSPPPNPPAGAAAGGEPESLRAFNGAPNPWMGPGHSNGLPLGAA